MEGKCYRVSRQVAPRFLKLNIILVAMYQLNTVLPVLIPLLR